MPLPPSVRRPLTLSAAAVLAAASAPLVLDAPSAQAAASDIVPTDQTQAAAHRQVILDEINAYRASKGLHPVAYSPTITQIAQDESDRAVRDEDYRHSGAFITDPRKGPGVTSLHEVTALEHRIDPAALVAWWKTSPSHDAAILSPDIDVIGIGVTVADGSLERTGQPWRLVGVVDAYGYAPGYGPSDARTSVTGGAPAPAPVPQSVQVPSLPGPFADVPGDMLHADAIAWARDRGVLTGWDDGTFRPHESIERQAMAAAAYRMAGEPAFTPPAVSPFRDVQPGDPFYREVTWARANGYLTGWEDGTFRPHEPIQRDAVAALLWRASGSPQPSAPSGFTDVVPGQQHGRAIAWMAEQELATGWGDGSFRPTEPIARDAAAAFLQRYAQAR